MFDKLRQIEERWGELNRQLSDPAVISQPALYARTAKSASELSETVEKFGHYKAVLTRISEARHILAEDPDREMRDMAQAEIDELSAEQARLEDDLRTLLIPRDPNDDKNVFLEIRAGAGGDEAALFAADLVRMYTKYAERQRWKVETIDVHDCAQARQEEYREGTLTAGHVLTVEPGLYFQPNDRSVPEEFRGIGVRIEDDIVVTDGAPINLSGSLPRDPDEIVAWMRDAQNSPAAP